MLWAVVLIWASPGASQLGCCLLSHRASVTWGLAVQGGVSSSITTLFCVVPHPPADSWACSQGVVGLKSENWSMAGSKACRDQAQNWHIRHLCCILLANVNHRAVQVQRAGKIDSTSWREGPQSCITKAMTIWRGREFELLFQSTYDINMLLLLKFDQSNVINLTWWWRNNNFSTVSC